MLIHLEISDQRTSCNCCLVGAVATILGYGKQVMNQRNTAASRPVFPTPCPDLILTFGFAAKSLAASACHSSGSKLSTSRKNITGSFRHSGMLSSRNSENCISSIFVLSFPCFYHSFGPCTNNLIALAFSGNLLLFKSQLRKCFNSLGLL